jgi:hypothetical protein
MTGILADSHRLREDEFANWDGSPSPRKLPVLIHDQNVAPSACHLAPGQAGVWLKAVSTVTLIRFSAIVAWVFRPGLCLLANIQPARSAVWRVSPAARADI